MALHEKNKVIKRADDESVAIKIKVTSYSTTGAVVLNDTTLTVNVDGTTSAFDLSAAAYNTMGEVADALNAVSNVEAVLVDSLRSIASNADTLKVSDSGTLTNSLTVGATGSDGASVYWDSSNLHQYIVAVQEDDLPSKASSGHDVSDEAFENLIYEIRAKLTDTNCTNTLSVYQCVGTTETEIWTLTGAATSDEQTFFSSETVPISGGDPVTNGRLVAVLTCDTTHGATWLEVRGKSVNRVAQAVEGCE